MAKNKYIETPEKLLEMWEDYKRKVKENPRFINHLNKFGEIVPVPMECPLTQQGFEVFCKNKFNVTIGHYFDNPDNAYDEYRAICSHIKAERQDDQITGGMIGQYNASITQRLNNLAEKVEQEHSGEIKGMPTSIQVEIKRPDND